MSASTDDDILIQRHEEYLKRVTESGLPLWMADQYTREMSYGVENRPSHENEPKEPMPPHSPGHSPDLPF